MEGSNAMQVEELDGGVTLALWEPEAEEVLQRPEDAL